MSAGAALSHVVSPAAQMPALESRACYCRGANIAFRGDVVICSPKLENLSSYQIPNKMEWLHIHVQGCICSADEAFSAARQGNKQLGEMI